MSHPITHDWFSLSIRRNRKSFIGANISVGLIMALVEWTLLFFEARQSAGELIYVMFNILSLIAVATLVAQRLRDLNVNGWYAFPILALPLVVGLGVGVKLFPEALISFLPLLMVTPLYCFRGTKGPNRYGKDCLA
jgi:uncharacterized membrane protein YhaH (DUF805 family)